MTISFDLNGNLLQIYIFPASFPIKVSKIFIFRPLFVHIRRLFVRPSEKILIFAPEDLFLIYPFICKILYYELYRSVTRAHTSERRCV